MLLQLQSDLSGRVHIWYMGISLEKEVGGIPA